MCSFVNDINDNEKSVIMSVRGVERKVMLMMSLVMRITAMIEK